ncbi:MAG: tRNA (guanosine(46)-N7)-methyltransferase TrmB [Cytophagales bacterium]
MGKNKLRRFATNDEANNVIQEGKPLFSAIKGKWNSFYFKNNNPIVSEIGCGYGEYTTGLAEAFPAKNFIGIDIKGARIFKGSQYAIEKKLINVGFLRTRVEFLLQSFAPNEVDEIWITFPDPQLKDGREKHRLTHPRFLFIYKQFLKENGIIHLKTDSRELMDYTLEVLSKEHHHIHAQTFDLYRDEKLLAEQNGIQTKYEKVYLASEKPINYLKFSLT